MSDGISTTLLEAMSRGTFPIQTSTSCAEEWLDHGCGYLVGVDASELELALMSSLRDDELINDAATRNRAAIAQRAGQHEIKERNRRLYEKLSSLSQSSA